MRDIARLVARLLVGVDLLDFVVALREGQDAVLVGGIAAISGEYRARHDEFRTVDVVRLAQPLVGQQLREVALGKANGGDTVGQHGVHPRQPLLDAGLGPIHAVGRGRVQLHAGVDQAGDDELARGIDFLRLVRRVDLRSNLLDGAVDDQDLQVGLRRLAGAVDEGRVLDDQRWRVQLSEDAGRESENGNQQQE